MTAQKKNIMIRKIALITALIIPIILYVTVLGVTVPKMFNIYHGLYSTFYVYILCAGAISLVLFKWRWHTTTWIAMCSMPFLFACFGYASHLWGGVLLKNRPLNDTETSPLVFFGLLAAAVVYILCCYFVSFFFRRRND